MSDKSSLILARKTNRKKEEYKYFVGSTLKNPLEYTSGERIVFRIRPKFMDGYIDVPSVRYSVYAEHSEIREGVVTSSPDGWFYIETSLPQCGFAYVRAEACGENGEILRDIEPYNGSAGADVAFIKRATKKPSDYTEFWENMKRRVEDTEPEILFSEQVQDPDYPDYNIYDMRIKAPGGEYASLMVSYPKDAKPGTLKLAMFFQGYGVATAPVLPVEGYLTVFVCGHAIPNRKSPEYYSALFDSAFSGYAYDPEENKSPETAYFCGMLLRDLAALRFFEDHELINKKDYCFIGSSQGGMQACNVAAHYGRASMLILNVPWLSDIYGHELAGRRENGMPKGEGITYFDTAVAAEGVKCPVYIISGLGDLTCNSSTQMALFNSIPGRKYIEFYQNKTHSITIPWDDLVYTLGDGGIKDDYLDIIKFYKDFN